MNKESIVAMAVAAVAEMLGTDVKKIKVITFREVEKNSLEKYIEEKSISYSKYKLGE